MSEALAQLLAEIRACRICRDAPEGPRLPHEPRPVVRVSATCRILIAGQAPGTRVHASGLPFDDPSGDRLRAWMGIDRDTFYDTARIGVAAMGFCFPGLDGKGADLPPRRECAQAWRARLFALLPQVDLLLVIGQYALRWHLARLGLPTPSLAPHGRASLTGTVAGWRAIHGASTRPKVLPLPHPSWRNSGWLQRNAWFERDVLPVLRAEVARCLRPLPAAPRRPIFGP